MREERGGKYNVDSKEQTENFKTTKRYIPQTIIKIYEE
jgi:hypothetical protein